MIKLHKPLVGSVLAVATVIGAFNLAWARDTRTVRVESKDKERATRNVEGAYKVELIRRLSDRPCVRGFSWDFRNGKIWVDDGCRAEFRAYFRKGDDSDWDEGRPGDNWNGDSRVRLESLKGEYRSIIIGNYNRAKVIRQFNMRPCAEGRTYGISNGRLWVKDGCRAEFQLSRR